MCGLFGVVALSGRAPSIDEREALRLRDLLTHRGPDAAGIWRAGPAILAHRRLSVIEPGAGANQPMTTPDGRFAIVYNGELYNDADLRRDLESRGARFQTRCDTETVLLALAHWGMDALPRMRGMFALGLYDTRLGTLTLARDPLGVKPLYFHTGPHEITFASEPGPIVAHPRIGARPNWRMVSAYLTTIRTVLGNDTMFEGVHALGPGQAAQCDLSGAAPVVRLLDYWRSPSIGDDSISESDAARVVSDRVDESVHAHLRSDVPTCALLSGGLDSTVIASLARREMADLRTYCAGAREGAAMGAPDNDLFFARLAARQIGTKHAEAVVHRELFAEVWPAMIARLGVPLSTPNETAIYTVASRLRADGCVVTLSGEGADELFAGYAAPMISAARFLEARLHGEHEGVHPGLFELESNAWMSPSIKAAALTDAARRRADDDRWLRDFYTAEFDRSAAEALSDAPLGAPAKPSLDAHLRMQRRINLTGLLQRLDTATMLAGVEGRTPFADAVVAALADSLPMAVKFEAPVLAGAGAHSPIDSDAPPRTKIALREAFRGAIPDEVIDRPKASFPLPFQSWIADHAPALRRSSFARELFTEAAIETVGAQPENAWQFAWPMINAAMWGERWWG